MSRGDPAAKTVFLDRDGTINAPARPGSYITRPEQLRLLPGAATAIRRLNEGRVTVFVVTNQRGVDLGMMAVTDLDAVHGRLEADLRAGGARVDGIYACTHGLHGCGCRKPAPGLIARALAEHPDAGDAALYLVGDSEADVEAGRAAGATTVLLAPAGVEHLTPADHVADDLPGAVDWILGR